MARRPDAGMAAGSTAPDASPERRCIRFEGTLDGARAMELTARNPARFPPPFADARGDDLFGLWADLVVETGQGRAEQRLRCIEAGTFRMGSPADEPERGADEGPQHLVTLTRGFWLGDTACTQALWQAVTGKNPSYFKEDPQSPVEQVSWREVQGFLRALEELLPPGCAADLPSEAEWEYACRAGTETPFSFGATVTPGQVNYEGNYPYAGGAKGLYRAKTVPVRSLPANAWGLYEMHGNVWEWCIDGWRGYDGTDLVDPRGPEGDGTPRAVRGGSCLGAARRARSASRIALHPGGADRRLGFRLCLRSIESGVG
jgi:formylglycine-generating enzyme required for sulfatase activity